MARPTLKFALFFLMVSALWMPLDGQQLTAAEIQRLLQNPQTAQSLRSQLEASGLDAAQIRAQLLAAGIAPSDLDSFMRATGSSGLAASDSAIGPNVPQDFVDSIRASAEEASPDDALMMDPATPCCTHEGFQVRRCDARPKQLGPDLCRIEP